MDIVSLRETYGESASDSQRQADNRKTSAITAATQLAMYSWLRVHGDDGVAYAIGSAGCALPIEGRAFHAELTRRFWRKERHAASSAALTTAINTAVADTLGGNKRPVWNRIGGNFEALYVALYDGLGSFVKITANGWNVVTPQLDSELLPEAVFHQPADALPLPEPVPAGTGNVDDLRPFVNVATEADWLLLKGWLLGAMMPRGPYPLLVLSGEAGSGKSTLARTLRTVLDPSKSTDRGAPRDLDAVVVAARHCRVLPLDNLSFIGNEMSDLLCRISSGGSVGARALYTNYDEATVRLERPIIINGIADLVARGDLASRTIALSLPQLAVQNEDEQTLDDAFSKAHASILGGLLDACVRAIAGRPNVNLGAATPRLAGFAKWAAAAFPSERDPFMDAYAGNRRQSTHVVLDSDPLAGRLMEIASEGFEGYTAELLERVGSSPNGSDRSWPRTAAMLGNRVSRLAGALRDMGLTVVTERKTKGTLITLEAAGAEHVPSAPPRF